MKFINRSQAKKQTGLSYLGSINSSAKLIKNKKVSNNYTYILYLAPASASGYNVCPHSTPECRIGCLSTSGRVKVETYSNKSVIQNARVKKTKMFFEDQDFFMNWMVAEMIAYKAKAKRDGYYFSARLNGTSDIEWENITLNGQTIFEIFPDVQFYDYTKNPARILAQMPDNYHLTLSYTGKNEYVCKKTLERGRNVAIIYNVKKGQPLPTQWNGYPVIDGDLTDYRPYDGEGVVVGLRWKDIANKENNNKIKQSHFVVQVVKVPESYKVMSKI
jgi:hypothetical protein